MIDFDQETWVYIAITGVFLLLYVWSSRRVKQNRKASKNKNFRRRYLERRQKEREASESLYEN